MKPEGAKPEQGFRGSPVVGYVRSAEHDDPRLDQWEAGLRRYAAENGYNLVEVVRDEGVSAVAVWKPGLERVLRDVGRGSYAGILVPSSRTLGQTPTAVRRTRQRVEHDGAWLEIVGLTG